MPAYNAGRTISESIDSVLSQSYQDWELLVVDDCSKDNTLDIIQKYAECDDRIVVVRNEKNLGVAATRNKAIAMARGEWIAFLDADDLWRADKLEKQVALMQSDGTIDMSYTASAFMDNDGNQFSYIMPVEKNITFNELLHRNVMSCSSVMLKSDLMKSIKMPNDKMHEEYYCWLTFLKSGRRSVGINEPLLVYRLGTATKSSNRLKAAMMSYNTYRGIGLSCFYSAYLVFLYTFYSVGKRRKIYAKN